LDVEICFGRKLKPKVTMIELPESDRLKGESEVAQSCPTLSNPMDCSLPGSSIHGVLQARALEWAATALSEDLTGISILPLLH